MVATLPHGIHSRDELGRQIRLTDDFRGTRRERFRDRHVQLALEQQNNRDVVFRAALSQQLTRGDAVHHRRVLSEQHHPQVKLLGHPLNRIEVREHQDRLEVHRLQTAQPGKILLRLSDDQHALEHRLGFAQFHRDRRLRQAFLWFLRGEFETDED